MFIHQQITWPLYKAIEHNMEVTKFNHRKLSSHSIVGYVSNKI